MSRKSYESNFFLTSSRSSLNIQFYEAKNPDLTECAGNIAEFTIAARSLSDEGQQWGNFVHRESETTEKSGTLIFFKVWLAVNSHCHDGDTNCGD